MVRPQAHTSAAMRHALVQSPPLWLHGGFGPTPATPSRCCALRCAPRDAGGPQHVHSPMDPGSPPSNPVRSAAYAVHGLHALALALETHPGASPAPGAVGARQLPAGGTLAPRSRGCPWGKGTGRRRRVGTRKSFAVISPPLGERQQEPSNGRVRLSRAQRHARSAEEHTQLCCAACRRHAAARRCPKLGAARL